MIDIHSHILPGIDDGAKTLTDSIKMIQFLKSQGVTDIIATPHYIHESSYTSTCTHNWALLCALKQALATAGISIDLYLGNEIYIDNHIVPLITSRKAYTLAGSRYLLVELPMSGEFANYEEVLRTLMARGYRVILAHPERYVSIQNNFELIRRLHHFGILLQCNLGSITGQYGAHAKDTIIKLAKQKMIFAFGSDIHRAPTSWSLSSVTTELKKYYTDRELTQLLITNPSNIINRQ